MFFNAQLYTLRHNYIRCKTTIKRFLGKISLIYLRQKIRLGLTQQEISDKIGLSQNRISEIIGKFKNELIDNPVVPDSLQPLLSIYI